MFGLFKKKATVKEGPPVFFSILLSQNLAQAALWTIDNGLVYIKNKSQLKPYFNEADCLVKLDECLQELGSEGEAVNQTIFHLDHSFADEHGIYPEKKAFFKNLLSSLQLKSIGFVANTEAVLGSKIEEDGAASHNLIIEFTKHSTLFSLFEGKMLLDTYSAENNLDLASQFQTASTQFEANLDLSTLEFLNVILTSALLSTEELSTKESSFPEQLPLKFTYLGSDILLPVVAVPGATAIAKVNGWLTPPLAAPEEEGMAPITTTEPSFNAAPISTIVSREASVQAPMQAPVSRTTTKPKKILPSKPFIIAGAAAGVLVAAVIIFFVIVIQAVATITIQPKTTLVNKTIEVTIDPAAKTSDADELVLPGQLENEEITDRVTVEATGKKAVGEKATGTVTIVNKRTKEQRLSSGTTLTTSSGIAFVLQNDITVEAAEEDVDKDGNSVTRHTKKEAAVVASEIGANGNINADTKLRVAAYSSDDLEAFSKDNFSGGVSKDVTVIAAADISKATKDVTAALTAQAEKLGRKESGKFYTPIVGDLKITKKDISAEAGEEARELVLIATATVPMIAYDVSDLRPFVLDILEKEVPEGFAMIGEPEMMSAVDEAQKESDTLTLQVDLTSLAAATIDLGVLQQELLGQELMKVDNILKGNQAVKAYEIIWSNNLYGKIFGKLPSNTDKLTLSFYNTSP